jgi:hypothetical protein
MVLVPYPILIMLRSTPMTENILFQRCCSWAYMCLTCVAPCIAYMDDDAYEEYCKGQTLLYRRVLNCELCARDQDDRNENGWEPVNVCGNAFACFCRVCCCDSTSV